MKTIKTLNANKTSLYQLVSAYVSLPNMRQTTFKKAFRSPSYWLVWRMEGCQYLAYLTTILGSAKLLITATGDDRSAQHDAVHTISLSELAQRDMVKTTERSTET